MSSGDFNNLALRNTTSYNPDGSFVSTGYVFTVSTNGRQLWTNNLALNNLSASTFTLTSTFTVASNIVNSLTVNSTALVSSLSVSGALSFSTLTGSTLFVSSGANIGSTLTVSTLLGNNGSFGSTLTVSTLNGSNAFLSALTLAGSGSVASTLTVSSLVSTYDSYFSSTLYGSTVSSVQNTTQDLLVLGSGSVASTLGVSTLSTTNGQFQSLVVNGNGTVASTLSVSTLSTANGQFQSLAVTGNATMNSTLTVSSLAGVSTFYGSTIWSNILRVSTIYVSSVISDVGFGATGPAGPTGAAGSGGGGGGGGTGYTGPMGPTGASGQTAVITMSPSATQTITAINTVVKWGTMINSQSTGVTGFSYDSGTGLFTNITSEVRPLLIEYAVALDVTGNGAVFVGLNGASAAYGVQHVTSNYFSGSATVLVPAGQTVGLYYSDSAPSVVVQTSSLISLSVLAAGSQGPTGAPGGTSTVSVWSSTSTGQSISASTNTELLWPSTDFTQTQGVTGLTYSAGRYTNSTILALPLQIEYQVTLSSTSGGASFIGINGSSSVYGQTFNDNNVFNNNATILLQPGSYFSVWYADNAATTVVSGSRITVTLLVAGMGPTGPQGPISQVATLSRFPSANQAIPASTDTVVLFASTETSQTVGNTGLTYTPATGLFTNTTSTSLPLLVEYAVGLNTTGNGVSYVGLTPFGSTVTAYGTVVNTTNYFTNSYVVQVAPGAAVGVYYRDNSAITVQAALSRVIFTLLVAGQPGVAGPAGQVASYAATPSVTQALTPSVVSPVQWGSVDVSQTVGSVGITYSAGTALFTNTTASVLPLSIQYALVLNTTGNGSSYIGVTPSGSSTVIPYGVTTNLQNIFTNAFTLQLGVGASVGIYYVDNSAVTVQTTSRLSITLLTAGAPGAAGVTGPQGMTGPVGQVSKASRTATGSQAITASATGVVVLFDTVDLTQSAGSPSLTYASGLFTNITSATLPVLVEYYIALNTTQGGYSYVGVNGNVNAFGGMYNDANAFSSSYTVMVPSGQTVGVYYLDSAASVTVGATSRVSVTVLSVGPQGPTGPAGPTTDVVKVSRSADGGQSVTGGAGSGVAVLFTTVDAAQSSGSSGLTYATGTGLFTNTTSASIPVLVQYSIQLNTTQGGYSFVGVNGNVNAFGGMFNDTNSFSNSYTVIVPSGETVGVYYQDNTTVTVQNTSKISITVLTAGPVGPTGSAIWQVSGSNTHYTVGSVGVGTSTPSVPLTVQGATPQFQVQNATDPTARLRFQVDSNGNGEIDCFQGATARNLYLNTNAGAILSNTIYPVTDNTYFCGLAGARWAAVYSANGTIQTSDSAVKDAEPLVYGLKEIQQVKPIKYKWKAQADLPDDNPAKHFEYYGFCADELAEVFPELVYDEEKEAPVQMNYSEILPVMVNAVKELSEKATSQAELVQDLSLRATSQAELVQELSEKNKELSQQNQELSSKNQQLTEQVTSLSQQLALLASWAKTMGFTDA